MYMNVNVNVNVPLLSPLNILNTSLQYIYTLDFVNILWKSETKEETQKDWSGKKYMSLCFMYRRRGRN